MSQHSFIAGRFVVKVTVTSPTTFSWSVNGPNGIVSPDSIHESEMLLVDQGFHALGTSLGMLMVVPDPEAWGNWNKWKLKNWVGN